VVDIGWRARHATKNLRRWTNRSRVNPRFDQRPGDLLRSGCGRPSEARRPGPSDKCILTDVIDQIVGRAATVPGRVFDLEADFPDGFTLPCHLKRREMPIRVARHATRIEVGVLVTTRTPHGWQAKAVGAAFDGRLVQMAVVTLPRAIPGRMTIHAMRACQDLAKFREKGG
jgi:hypothetical protein